jgi:hypothetical protein
MPSPTVSVDISSPLRGGLAASEAIATGLDYFNTSPPAQAGVFPKEQRIVPCPADRTFSGWLGINADVPARRFELAIA